MRRLAIGCGLTEAEVALRGGLLLNDAGVAALPHFCETTEGGRMSVSLAEAGQTLLGGRC